MKWVEIARRGTGGVIAKRWWGDAATIARRATPLWQRTRPMPITGAAPIPRKWTTTPAAPSGSRAEATWTYAKAAFSCKMSRLSTLIAFCVISTSPMVTTATIT